MGEPLPRSIAGGRSTAARPDTTGPRPVADEHAVRSLYERHSDRILRYCAFRLGSREEAEDALQTTFLHAQRALSRGVVPQSEEAWLFTIARNVCLSNRRSSRLRARRELTHDPQALELVAPPADHDPDDLFGMRDALAAMPERQRQVLLLREWRGLSYAEIGASLGLGQAAVESLLFRARRTLAQALEAGTPLRRRLRRALDFGLLAGWCRTTLAGGSTAKVAAGVASAAAAVALTTDGLRSQAPARAAPPDAVATPAGAAASAATAPPEAVSERHTARRPAPSRQTGAPVKAAPAPTPPGAAPTGQPRARGAQPRAADAARARPPDAPPKGSPPEETPVRAEPAPPTDAPRAAPPAGAAGGSGRAAPGPVAPSAEPAPLVSGPAQGGQPGTVPDDGSLLDGADSLLSAPAAALDDLTPIVESATAVLDDHVSALGEAAGTLLPEQPSAPEPTGPDPVPVVADPLSQLDSLGGSATLPPPVAAPTLPETRVVEIPSLP